MKDRSNLGESEERTIGRLLGRALLLRCPNCGDGALFQSWIRLRPNCAGCGLHYDRGEHDHFLGAYLINFIVAEMLVVIGLVAFMIATWPAVPWSALTWGLVLMVVVAPFGTYPYSRAVWLALDMRIQPERPGDFGTEQVAGG